MRKFRVFKTKEERKAFEVENKIKVCFREPTKTNKAFYEAHGIDVDIWKYAVIYK